MARADSTPICVRLPIELAARVDAAAGRNRSAWIKRALEQALSEGEGTPWDGSRPTPGPVGSKEPVRSAAPARASKSDAELPKIARRHWAR
jgi:hypothetical protein